jgi:hypothetical protein
VAEFLAAIVGPLDQAEIQGFPERTMGGTCHRETLQFAATKRGVVSVAGSPPEAPLLPLCSTLPP